MQKYILWKNETSIVAGTTLKVAGQIENFNMGLHVTENKAAVIQNRNRFSADFKINVKQCVFAKQTHSDHLVEVTRADMGKGSTDYASAIEDCDALYTKDKNVMLGVFHADCVPVLIYDPVKQLICAIHSGWQGTVKEITAKAIQTLIDKEQCDPQNMLVYIGPAISQNNFEVGEDVIEKVAAMSFDTSAYIYHKNDKAFVDNRGLNRQMCLNANIPATNIMVDKNCTFANQNNFFSYRKDKECGRHMSFIMMR